MAIDRQYSYFGVPKRWRFGIFGASSESPHCDAEDFFSDLESPSGDADSFFSGLVSPVRRCCIFFLAVT